MTEAFRVLATDRGAADIPVQIRVSLYVLSVAGPIINNIIRSAELFRAIESSLGVTGFALFLTTVIATVRGSLALFHALCVFHLLGLVGISFSPKGRYPAGMVRTYTFLIFYVLAVAGSLSYMIYVFATAPTFGNQPECNSHTIYVLFWVNILATNNVLRWCVVTLLACMLLGFVIWLLVITGTGCCLAVDCMCGRRSYNPGGEWESNEEIRKGFPYHLISQLSGSAYAIAMLELMIHRNPLAPGAGEWTFGQVLAMMMLVGPLVELVSLLLGKADGGPTGQRSIESAVARERLGMQARVATEEAACQGPNPIRAH